MMQLGSQKSCERAAEKERANERERAMERGAMQQEDAMEHEPAVAPDVRIVSHHAAVNARQRF